MKRYKRLISSRALFRLNEIGIGRRFHSKQTVFRWYNKLGDNLIIKLGSFVLLVIAVILSYLSYNQLTRTPILKLSVKECWADTSGRLHIIPQILNKGNETATKCSVLLLVPVQFGFESSNFIVSDSTANMQQWSCDFPTFIPFQEDKEPSLETYIPSISFTLKSHTHGNPPYRLLYYLSHDKGTDKDTLIIDPSKCY